MKKVLNKEEIIDYILSLDTNSNVSKLEAYLENYGMGQLTAELKSVPIKKLIVEPENNDLLNMDRKNSKRKVPILIDENYHVLDGFNRVDSQKKQNKKKIQAYVISIKNK